MNQSAIRIVSHGFAGERPSPIEISWQRPYEYDGIITQLAKLPRDTLIDVKGIAGVLGKCNRSVQRAVARGELPEPFMQFGKHVWLAGTLNEHFQCLQREAIKHSVRRDNNLLKHNP